ncbi:hypothetical protein [Nonomuraea cavernae]|uniref:hypothetical protein n=1 Tax=Nonomuraea cavernae TaxID=2045107 RepID=UPI00340D8415
MVREGADALRRLSGDQPHPARTAERRALVRVPALLFKNESADILALCGEALDLLDVAWRHNKRNEISVARGEAVERLDEFVGPTY